MSGDTTWQPPVAQHKITDIKEIHPDALKQIWDHFSHIDPLDFSLGNVRGFQGTGAMAVVERKELAAAAASLDFQNIPQQFKHLRLLVYSRSAIASAADDIGMRLNNDSGGNYYRQTLSGSSNTNVAASGLAGQTSLYVAATAGNDVGFNDGFFGSTEVLIPFYSSANRKTFVAHGFALFAKNAVGLAVGIQGGAWDNTSPITRLTLFLLSGNNFMTGSVVTLYAHN